MIPTMVVPIAVILLAAGAVLFVRSKPLSDNAESGASHEVSPDPAGASTPADR